MPLAPRSTRLTAPALLLAAALTPFADAQTTTVIVQTGDAAPDGNGAFLNFEDAALNDAGQAAFLATFSGTAGGADDDQGVFRGDGLTAPVRIAREGQASPDGNGTFTTFPFGGSAAINNAGQVAFSGFLTGTTGGFSDEAGIFRGDGSTALVQIARGGQAAPDGNGSFDFFNNPSINGAGQVAFGSILTGTAGGFSDIGGIFRGGGSTALVQIAREGQAAPDGNGVVSSLNTSAPPLNALGQVALGVTLTGTAGGDTDNAALFRGDGAGPSTQVARKGQAVPGGNGVFESFESVTLNDAGHTAFLGFLDGTAGGSSDNVGIYIADGVAPPLQVAREGQAAPDGNGSYDNFNAIAFNNAGQTAFLSELTGTSGGSADAFGVFRGDGLSAPVRIARAGEAVPGGNGVFEEFDEFSFNDAGQVVFPGSLTGTAGGSSDNQGLYFFDDTLGLIEIARKGDAFLGSTINSLGFRGGTDNDGTGLDGLNENGQLAYNFFLANGTGGVAVWSPAAATIAGDYNNSGQVEQGDLNLVLQNWGVDTDVAGVPAGWVNDLPSGRIEQSELNRVLQNWGNTSAPNFSGSVVPEPTSLAMLGVGGVIVTWRRRRTR